MRSTLLSYFLAFLNSVAAAQGVCGDCNRDGQVSVLDALAAARHDLGLTWVPFVHQWRCDVTGSGAVDILDALFVAQSVAGLPVSLGCAANPVGYALYMTYELSHPSPLFADSFDSTAGPYSPTLPVGSPFTTPWQGSSGAVGCAGPVTLTNPMNEIHGALHFGTTSSVAGLLAFPPVQQPPASFPSVDFAEWVWVLANNDNDDINVSAVLDPLHYGTTYPTAYDPSLHYLYAAGPQTRIFLGDPGGQPRRYALEGFYVGEGATLEFVGPTTLYVSSALLCDHLDGVANCISALPSGEVTIIGAFLQFANLDCEPGFAALLYLPDTDIVPGHPVDFTGAIIGAYLDNAYQLPIALHYDEALRR